MATEIYRPFTEMLIILITGSVGLLCAVAVARIIWRKRHQSVRAQLRAAALARRGTRA